MNFNNFRDWCLQKENLPPETRHTVEVLLENAYTSDCEVASEKLFRRQELWLVGKKICDLTPLQFLRNLKSLEIFEFESYFSDLSPLSSLLELRTLSLTSHLISDLIPLANLTNLIDLDLSGQQISDLTPLSTLTSLRKFSLSNSQVTDLSPLAHLTQLTELNLINTPILDFSAISQLSNLTQLKIFNSQLSQLQPLAALKSLEFLDISDNAISDIQPLAQLANLTRLNLSSNQVFDLTPLPYLTQLMTLFLEDNQISDLTPLQSLTQLAVLYLKYNQIFDLTPLQSLKQLTFLDISENPVTNVQNCQAGGEASKLFLNIEGLTIQYSDTEPLNITFKNWVKYFFDRPVTDPQWYWQDGEAWLERNRFLPTVTVSYLYQLFTNAEEALKNFSDDQLNQGFWHLISSGISDYIQVLFEPKNEVNPLDKKRTIQAIYSFFEQFLLLKCSPHLGHLEEIGKLDEGEVNPLNFVCYMWWDILSYAGNPHDALNHDIDREILSVMKKILYLNLDSLKESALHGLGHWYSNYPHEVSEIIEKFLNDSPHLKPELRAYALQAKTGCVL
jgi:internalin A